MNTQTLQKSKKRPRIWAIGGGKGGVGKSVVSILLALENRCAGHRPNDPELTIMGYVFIPCSSNTGPESGWKVSAGRIIALPGLHFFFPGKLGSTII
ncbi:MAG: hypothetical protein C4519_03460 [Desulfobacteraceae bacterium]|nr:MAG: hypothetical protein C4519_03460 [Desulfobacteraceae bacterium]